MASAGHTDIPPAASATSAGHIEVPPAPPAASATSSAAAKPPTKIRKRRKRHSIYDKWRTPAGFACPVCGTVVKYPFNLQRHMKMHERGKTVGRNLTDPCGKVFRDAGGRSKTQRKLLSNSHDKVSAKAASCHAEPVAGAAAHVVPMASAGHTDIPPAASAGHIEVPPAPPAASATSSAAAKPPTKRRKRRKLHSIYDKWRTPAGFVCPVCGKVVQYPYNFERHVQIHERGKTVGRNLTDPCGKVFRDAGGRSKTHRKLLSNSHDKVSAKAASCRAEPVARAVAHVVPMASAGHTDIPPAASATSAGHIEVPPAPPAASATSSAAAKPPTKRRKRGKRHSIYDKWRTPAGFVCPVCGKVVQYPYIFERHMKIHERGKTVGRNLTDPCGKVFRDAVGRSKTQRKLLSNSHDKVSAKAAVPRQGPQSHDKVACDVCGREFQTAVVCAAHRRRHFWRGLARCRVCSATFSREQHLSRHIRNHESETSEPVRY